uniref:Phospholipase A2 n=1 Tax=Takifugu rubripes TaxID=31033 RepID=A0A674P5M1_TAKRU
LKTPQRMLIFLCVAVTAASTGQRRAARSKRGLLELAGAIKCSTGRSALAYMMYGCYCGLGGQGWPRDRADWCCHRHDCCYGDAERFGSHIPLVWELIMFCLGPLYKCEKLLCKCDMEAARCLRRAPFSQKYAMWPDFLCGYKQPTCNIYSLNVPLCK